MGYTTKFRGAFTIWPQLTMDGYAALRELADSEPVKGVRDGRPDGYCQWVPTKDGKRLEWDGGEKFYDYGKWLTYIIAVHLAPKGHTLTGDVRWQGEDMDDRGTLRVSGNTIEEIKDGPPEDATLAPLARELYEALKGEAANGDPSTKTIAVLAKAEGRS